MRRIPAFLISAAPLCAAPAPEGLKALAEHRCVACHALPEAAAQLPMLDLPAPELREVSARRGAGSIREFLRNPPARSHMPDLLRGEDIDAIVDFLVSRGGPMLRESEAVSTAEIHGGEQLFKRIGCAACHAEAAPFPGLAARTSLSALQTFLADPSHARPSGRMPPMKLARHEARSIAAWLLRERLGAELDEPRPGLSFALWQHGIDALEALRERPPDFAGVHRGELRLGGIPTLGPALDEKAPQPGFGIRFEGLIDIPEDGKTRFRVGGSQRMEFEIDGERLLYRTEKERREEAGIELEAGLHPIVLRWSNADKASYGMDFSWTLPGEKRRRVPARALFHRARRLKPLAAGEAVFGERADAGRAAFVSRGCVRCHAEVLNAPALIDLRAARLTAFHPDRNAEPPNDDAGPDRAVDGRLDTAYAHPGREKSGMVLDFGRPVNLAGLQIHASAAPRRAPADFILEAILRDGKTQRIANGNPRLGQRIGFKSKEPLRKVRLSFPKMADKNAGPLEVAETQWFAAAEPIQPSDGKAGPPLAELDPSRGCLADAPAAGVPDYGLGAGRRRLLRDTVTEIRRMEGPPEPSLRVATLMHTLNCVACHAREDVQAVAGEHRALFHSLSPVDLGDEGELPPPLDRAGAKLSPAGWDAVLGGGDRFRPTLATRMPNFTRHAKRIRETFEAADADAVPAHEPDVSGRLVNAGRDLVGVEGFACVTCHSWGDKKSLGVPGPDLTDMVKRLRPAWFHAWLRDPAGLRPGTRMPAFWAEGAAAREDILKGDATQQQDAVWAYLSRGTGTRAPVGLDGGADRYALSPTNRPIVFRSFVDRVSAHAVTVGFPEGVHFAYDANRVRMVQAWAGDYLSAKAAWDGRAGRYAPIPSADILRFPDGPTLAVLETADAAWPPDVEKGKKGNLRRPEGWRYRGYRLLDSGAPVFLAAWKGIEIEETPRAIASGDPAVLEREFRLAGPATAGTVTYRAAVANKVEAVKDGAWRVGERDLHRIEGATRVYARDTEAGRELLAEIPVPSSILHRITW